MYDFLFGWMCDVVFSILVFFGGNNTTIAHYSNILYNNIYSRYKGYYLFSFLFLLCVVVYCVFVVIMMMCLIFSPSFILILL